MVARIRRWWRSPWTRRSGRDDAAHWIQWGCG
jgi:hypothetical protein